MALCAPLHTPAQKAEMSHKELFQATILPSR